MNKIVDEIYDNIEFIIENKQVNTATIVSITVSLMKNVELYPQLSGEDKKKVVLHLLNKIVDEEIPDEGELQNVKMILQTTIPIMIDTIVSADKKKLRLNVKKCVKCFDCLNQI